MVVWLVWDSDGAIAYTNKTPSGVILKDSTWEFEGRSYDFKQIRSTPSTGPIGPFSSRDTLLDMPRMVQVVQMLMLNKCMSIGA